MLQALHSDNPQPFDCCADLWSLSVVTEQLHLVFNAVQPTLVLLEAPLALLQTLLKVLLLGLQRRQLTLILTCGLPQT